MPTPQPLVLPTRCDWAKTERSIVYHDSEWGVPRRDPAHLFEMLVLEGAQAGLSWETILAKRENYRKVFEGFDASRLARLSDAKLERICTDPGIVRNRLKVFGVRTNAQAWIKLMDAKGPSGAVEHLWSVVEGIPQQARRKAMADVPAKTASSEAMSKDLRRLGFTFVGSTICYAFMQATGMVNDHLVGCPRHAVCQALAALNRGEPHPTLKA